MSTPRLQVRLRFQLDVGVVNNNNVPFFYQYFNQNLVAIFPHASYKSLSWKNRLGESKLYRLELIVKLTIIVYRETYLIRIISTKCLQNCASGDTKGAQTMKDGLLESANLGKLGINVQRIIISRKSVDVGLERRGSSLLHGIRGTFRHLDVFRVGSSSTLRFKILGTNQENTRNHAYISVVVIRESDLVLYQSALASLVNPKNFGSELEGSFSGERAKNFQISGKP